MIYEYIRKLKMIGATYHKKGHSTNSATMLYLSQKELAYYATSHWSNNDWPVPDIQNRFSTETHLSESKACI